MTRFVCWPLASILPVMAFAAGSALAATDSYPSTYRPAAGAPTLIRNAVILDGAGRRLDGADLLLQDGRIAAIGPGLAADGAEIVDAQGRWVTPGLIDVHSHLGVYASPAVNAHQDGNEATDPVTAGVWAEHAVWPQDPGFETALAGGVTTLQVLPGSANLIGGRGVTLRNVPATTMQEMKFPGAPHGLKMACGENPKRVYGGKDRAPSTRMGNVAGYRQAFADAQDYRRQFEKYDLERTTYEKKKSKDGPPPVPPKRDLRLETLVGAMNGDIQVHIHCYRADEMAVMLDLAREFGFKVAAFHHGVEAYKLADRLAQEGVCGALWADWWGFKMEAFDAVWENIAFVDAAGERLRDRPLGFRRRHPATQPGGRQGHGAWRTRGPRHSAGARDSLADVERRARARHRRPRRHARARQDRGRRAVEPRSVQRLRARGSRLPGRRARFRPDGAAARARVRFPARATDGRCAMNRTVP